MTRGMTDFLAYRLITQIPTRGRVRTAMLGGDRRVLQNGRVDAVINATAADGVALHGWLIRSRGEAPSRGLVVCAHGMWDSCARLMDIGEALTRAGFDVLLPDLRTHGQSGGAYLTRGAREVEDLNTMIHTARQAGAAEGHTFTVGFSIGGGIAVQLAAAREDCNGCVAMAPVASTRRIMRHLLRFWAPVMGRRKIARVIDRAGEIAGFDVDATAAELAAAELGCPIAIAHGRIDPTVPYSHGKSIAKAAGENCRAFISPIRAHNSVLWGRTDWIVTQLLAMA
jgi:pimeloyl-ACP methyl ester carboxylesterase